MGSPWKSIDATSTHPSNAAAPRDQTPPEARPPEPLGTRESFVSREATHGLDDLIVSEETMNQLKTILARLEHQKVLYEDWNLKRVDPSGARTALNLYGPPGRGDEECPHRRRQRTRRA